MLQHISRRLKVSVELGIAAIAIALLFAGCGGSSSSAGGGAGGTPGGTPSTTSGGTPSGTVAANTISGTAAGGAPLSGGLVYGIDAMGVTYGPALIGADGSYTLTLPAPAVTPILLTAQGAVGTDINLVEYSVSPSLNGIANITPVTTLVVNNAARKDCTLVICSGASLTASGVAAAASAVEAGLAPLFSSFGIAVSSVLTDNLVAGQVANQSAMDKMLDVVSIVQSGVVNTYSVLPAASLSNFVPPASGVPQTLMVFDATTATVTTPLDTTLLTASNVAGAEALVAGAGAEPLAGVWKGGIADPGSAAYNWERDLVFYNNMSWHDVTVATDGTNRVCSVAGYYSYNASGVTGTVTASVPTGAGVTCAPVGTSVFVPASAVTGASLTATLTLPVPTGAASSTPLTKTMAAANNSLAVVTTANPVAGVWDGQVVDAATIWDRTEYFYDNLTWMDVIVAIDGSGKLCVVSGTYTAGVTGVTATVTGSTPYGKALACTPIGTVISVPPTAITGSGIGSTMTLPPPTGAISSPPLVKIQ